MSKYCSSLRSVAVMRPALRAALATTLLAPALVALLPTVASAAPTLTASLSISSNPDVGPAGAGTLRSGGCVTVQVEYSVGGEALTDARIEMSLPADDWRSGLSGARVVGGLPFGNTPVTNWAPTYASPDSTLVLPIGNPDLAAGTAGSIFVNLCSNARVNPNGAVLDIAASIAGSNGNLAASPISLVNFATAGTNPLNVTKTAATIVPVLGPPGSPTTPGYELSWDVRMGLACTDTACGPLVGDLADTMPLNSYMVSVNRLGPTSATPIIPAPHPASGIDLTAFPVTGSQFTSGAQNVTVPVFIWNSGCTAASGEVAQGGSGELPETAPVGCATEYPSSGNQRGFRVTVWVPLPAMTTTITNSYSINPDPQWDANALPINRTASHTVAPAPALTLTKLFSNGSGTCGGAQLPFQPGIGGSSACTLYPQGPSNTYRIQYDTTAPALNAVVIDRLPAELVLAAAATAPVGWTVSYTTDNTCSTSTNPTDPMWTTVLPPLANVVCLQFSIPLTNLLANTLLIPVALRAGQIPTPGNVRIITNSVFGSGDNLTAGTQNQTVSRAVSVLNQSSHTLGLGAAPASIVSGAQTVVSLRSTQLPFVGDFGAHNWTLQAVLPPDVDFVGGGMSGNDFLVTSAPRNATNPAVALPISCAYTPATRVVRCVATGDSVDGTASTGVGSVNFNVDFRVQVRLGAATNQPLPATAFNDLGAVIDYPSFGPVSAAGASLSYIYTPTATNSFVGSLAVSGAPSLNLGKTIVGGAATMTAGSNIAYAVTLNHLSDSTSDLGNTYVYDFFGRNPATGAAVGAVTPEFVSVDVASQPVTVAYTCTPTPTIAAAVWGSSPCGVVTGVRLRPGYNNSASVPTDGLYPIGVTAMTVTIVVRAPANTPHLSSMSNQVGLTATQTAGVLLSTQPSLVVHQPFDLSIVKGDGGNTGAAIGSTISYSLLVSNAPNTDPVPAGSISVADVVPSELLPTAATGVGWSCSISGHTVTCTNPAGLAAGAALAPIAIQAVVQVTTIASVSNTAVVSPTDGNTANNSSTVVTPVVQIPIAVDDTFGVGSTLTITGSSIIANDVPNPLAALNPASIVVAPMGAGGGTIVNNLDGTITYSAPANPGTYITSYTICDLQPVPRCDSATISFVVASPAPIAPVAVDDAASVTAGLSTIINVPANDTDADGNLDVSSVTIVAGLGPSHGSVAVSPTGQVTYSVDAGFAGADAFTYSICDTTGLCDTAIVTITVTAVPAVPAVAPAAPVAVDDARTIPGNTSIQIVVASNDWDPDGDLQPGSVTVIAMPTHGAVAVDALGNVTYTPAAGYWGNDTFTYRICDTTNLCASAVVTVTITEVIPVRLPVTGVNSLDALLFATSIALLGLIIAAGSRRRSTRAVAVSR